MSAHMEVAKWRSETELPQPSWRRPWPSTDIPFGGLAWWKECGAKIAHFTLESALRCIEELKLKPQVHNEFGARLSVYRCRWCDWFHVGHTRPGMKNHDGTVYVDLGKE